MNDSAQKARDALEKERALRLLDERVKRLERESDDFDQRVRYIVSQVDVERARVARLQAERTQREGGPHA